MSTHIISISVEDVERMEVHGPDDSAFWRDELDGEEPMGQYALVVGSLDDALVMIGPLRRLDAVAQLIADYVAQAVGDSLAQRQ